MIDINLKRRSFLISSAAGLSSLVFARSGIAQGKEAVDLLNPSSPLVLPQNFSPSIWFTMESNGRTTVHIFRNEMGQHVGTALAQIVAEELGLSWEDVTIDYPQMDYTTINTYGPQLTGGSWSIFEEFDKLSRVSAAARQIILETGADLLGADVGDCIVEKSTVKDTIMGEKISLSEILSETVIDYEVSEEDLKEVTLKAKKDYSIIGRSVKSLDIPEKINGSARYAIDAHIPNMLYAKIIAPPKRMGSKIVSVNDDEAKKQVKGYITTLPINLPDQFLVGGFMTHMPLVIASSFPEAMRASKLIDVNWDNSACSTQSSQEAETEAFSSLKQKDNGKIFWKVGDYEKARNSDNVREIERFYKTSMVAHAPMEPMSALVNFVDEKLHIYAGSQMGTMLPYLFAQFLQMKPEDIIYHPHLIGGGFGKRYEIEHIIMASMASIQLKKPVKLIFTREDDMAFAHPRTPSVQSLKSVLREDKCIGIMQSIACANMQLEVNPFFADMLHLPLVDGKVLEADDAVKHETYTLTGADNWYDIENQSVYHHRQTSIEKTIPCRAVRSVSNNYTVFALESFIDEVAYEIDEDPLALRLLNLRGKGVNKGAKKSDPFPTSFGGGKRLANVLKIASGLANYGRSDLPEGTSLGIAASGAETRYNPSFVACIAQVAVDKSSAAIDVQKLICAIDAGIVINPDGVKAQVEGSLMWGLSAALLEKMTLDNGHVAERNFDTYKWQNMTKIPEIEIHIVENGIHPSGVGEPATCVVAPAIGNAIFNATGVRLRSLPFSREELFEGLDKKA